MSTDAVPSLQDAQRAAEAVAHLDAGIVLLYGSIALGTATEDSDIDLCLIFDDFGDYSARWSLATSAQSAVSAATGRPANIHVCDRPEWRALCECVSSFERHIASYAVVLSERPPREVDWDKQMPGPVTSAALAERDAGPRRPSALEARLCDGEVPRPARRARPRRGRHVPRSHTDTASGACAANAPKCALRRWR